MARDKNRSDGETDDEKKDQGPPYYAGYYKNPDLVSHNCLVEEIQIRETRFVDVTKCNPHVDEMAKPNRRFYLDILETYYHVLDPARLERIKQKAAEEFGWSPEETEEFFEKIRQGNVEKRLQGWQEKRKMQEFESNMNAMILNRTYRRLRKWIRFALLFAHHFAVPPLFGNRATIISEIILRQLCCLYNPPLRICRDTAKGRRAKFLKSVSDWGAFLVEYLHYELVSDDIERRRQMFMENRAILYPPTDAGEDEGEEEEEEEGEGEPEEEYHDEGFESEAERTPGKSEEEKTDGGETDEWETEPTTEAETDEGTEDVTEASGDVTPVEDADAFGDQEEE